MIPIVEDIAVTATVNFLEYPLRIISGMNIPDTPAVSATAEPEIPAKIIDESTLTCARPPYICPTIA